MEFSSSINSLSALVPVKFNYNSGTSLSYKPVNFSNNLSYYKCAAFNNLQDVALSNKNALFLTDIISVSSVFETTSNVSVLGNIPGTLFLTVSSNYAQYTGDTIFVGPSRYNKLVISVVPISADIVELYGNNYTPIVVDANYPYVVRTSNVPLGTDQQYRKLFKVSYKNNLISFKATTVDGDRYVSFGVDGIMRATGLMLNDYIFNPYLFTPELITISEQNIGFDPTAVEVQYHNDLESFVDRQTLNIKASAISDTNLLISSSIADILNVEDPSVNIALLKTNFTSTETYFPQYTNA